MSPTPIRFIMSAVTTMSLLSTLSSHAADTVADPLNSPQWAFMHEAMLGGEPFVFDNRVVVLAPASAEDALNVPVTFSVDSLGEVERVVVFADLNPIHKVLVYHPLRARVSLGFRIKIEQATPIRAAALTSDGVWHVGGTWVDAAGGGCTAPSYGRATGTWADTLGQVRYRRWQDDDDPVERLRLQVMHPMDTGLADGIPAFYIDQLRLSDDAGNDVAVLELYEPVSENPYFTFDIEAAGQDQRLRLSGRDINGNRIEQGLD